VLRLQLKDRSILRRWRPSTFHRVWFYLVLPEYRLPFFEQPHPLLMKLRPIDLLDTDEGTEAVIGQLEAATTGSFA